MSRRPAGPAQDDQLLAEAAEAVAERAHTRVDRAVLRLSGWFAEHTTARIVIAGTLLVVAVFPAIILWFFPDLDESLAGLGYIGVFLTNLVSTATLFIPVPGLTAAGQLLIITEGEKQSQTWLVGVAGGLGMAVGEVTAYYAGFLGAELARGRELPGPKRFHATIERVVRGIDWLMARWGMLTLGVLAAVPNPLFEVAGITAGSVRMPFRRFFLAVTTGKVIRGLMLAYLGHQLPFI
jgi:membrane protein DedA with SNARE-associated domain